MGFKLFDLIGTVSADTSPLDKSLASSRTALRGFASFAARTAENVARSFARASSGIANGFRSATSGGRGIFGALSLAAGSAGIFLTIRKAITGASDLNETLSKVGVVFGGAAGIVTAGADEMAKRFGVVKTEFLDAAANLGLVGKAAGMSQGEAAKMADSLAKLALDASSFFNVPLNEALMSMRSGLVGEAEPLRRFGVLLSEAAVKQEALTLGLARGKGELSESAKVRARVSIITRQLADAQGDLERTSGGFANQLKKLSGQVTNFLTSVGTKILPIFQSLVTGMTSLLGQFSAFFEANSGFVAAWAARVASAVSLVGLVFKRFPMFLDVARAVVREKVAQIAEVLGRIGDGIGRVGENLWGYIEDGGSIAVAFLKNLFTGFARFLETLFKAIGTNLASMIQNSLVDMFAGPAGAVLEKIPGMAPFAMMAKFGRVPAAPIQGDMSGLTGGALTKGIPDAFARRGFGDLFAPLPNKGDEIQGLIQRLHNVNVAEMFADMLGRGGNAVRGIPARKLTPVEQLNADNRRLLNGAPLITAGPRAKGAQEQAARTLRLRREREARTDRQEQGQLDRASFGKVGNLGRIAGGFADAATKKLGITGTLGEGAKTVVEAFGQTGRTSEAVRNFVDKLTNGGTIGGAIRGAASLATGGLGGLLAGRQPGRPGRGGIGGTPGPMAGKEFRSEFLSFSELSRRIQTDALSTSKKDPQLDALQGVQSALGGNSPSGNTVRGLLSSIDKKIGMGGAGFAT